MKRILVLLLIAAALGFCQVPMGQPLTKGPFTVVVTYFGCRAIPGVPLGPSPECVPGMMVSVQPVNSEQPAMLIGIEYLGDDGKPKTARAIVQTPTVIGTYATAAFYVGWHPVTSISITPLKEDFTITISQENR